MGKMCEKNVYYNSVGNIATVKPNFLVIFFSIFHSQGEIKVM